jgi:hypothetical protein
VWVNRLVARFFLVQQTKKYTKMVTKYTTIALKYRLTTQTSPSQGLPKHIKVGIFGMQTCRLATLVSVISRGNETSKTWLNDWLPDNNENNVSKLFVVQ